MQKKFKTIREYHDKDEDIQVHNMEGECFRVGLLSEESNDVRFTSTDRNGIVVDLTGTTRHVTRMDGINIEAPTRPGDVCFIPPGLDVRFAWQIKGSRQSSIMVEFDSSIFDHYAPEFVCARLDRGHLIPANYAQNPKVASMARLLASEVGNAGPQGRIYSESVMRLLTIEILNGAWSVPLSADRPLSGRDPRIKRAMEFIEEHYATDVSLLDISRAAGLSPTHLTTLFQQETRQTPYAYVIDRRLKQAIHLLRKTGLSIAQVSYEAGFSDQQHMTRAFRAKLRRTPKAVRQG